MGAQVQRLGWHTVPGWPGQLLQSGAPAAFSWHSHAQVSGLRTWVAGHAASRSQVHAQLAVSNVNPGAQVAGSHTQPHEPVSQTSLLPHVPPQSGEHSGKQVSASHLSSGANVPPQSAGQT